jgi:hypothetical protein
VNELALAPVTEMELIVRDAVPVFLSVMGWVVESFVPIAVLPKVSEVGEKVTIGA